MLVILAAVGLAQVYNLTQPKVYAANASGFVSAATTSDPSLASISDSLAKSRAASYVDLASSRATAEQVIDDLGLDTSPAALIGAISVEQPADTVVLRVTARGSTPEDAQKLADAWIAALQEQVRLIEDPENKNEAKGMRIVPVESAALPSAPLSPRVERNLMIGLLAGLVLGLGYALVRNLFDRRLRSASQVEREFKVSVIGAVPRSPMLARQDGQVAKIAVDVDSKQSADLAVAESYRKLRTNLRFMRVDDPPRTLVMTSPTEGDGKSTVAMNLAAAIAAGGQPVVLVDSDLRRPTVAKALGLVEGAGLTDVLVGRVQAEEVLQRHRDSDLMVMAAGRVPPNPSELLGSQTMRHLLEHLSERYLVILDAPPLLPVADAAVLTAIADGALVVISTAKTTDTELAASLRNLDAVSGTALGIIFNRVPRGNTEAGTYQGNYYRSDED